jgi:hypothetical protein
MRKTGRRSNVEGLQKDKRQKEKNKSVFLGSRSKCQKSKVFFGVMNYELLSQPKLKLKLWRRPFW